MAIRNPRKTYAPSLTRFDALSLLIPREFDACGASTPSVARTVRQGRARRPSSLLQAERIISLYLSTVTRVDFLGLRDALAGIFGIGFLLAESAMLPMQGVQSVTLALTAILVVSAVSSIAGCAFSVLCGALLFHLMDSPIYAVQVMIVCSIAIQSLSVASLWRSIDWSSLPAFMAGGILGAPAGVYLLLHFQTGFYRIVIGGLLIAFGGYLLFRRRTAELRVGQLSDACVGFLGGLTGALAGSPGASVTIWCGVKGWDKARQRGVYQPFNFGMQPITLIAIYLMKPHSAETAQLDWKALAFIPAALLGAWFGLRIFRHLSDHHFELAVNALLIVSGVGLIL